MMSVEINGRIYTHKTHSGRFARIVATDRLCEGRDVLALVLDKSQDYEEIGNFYESELTPIPATVKKQGYINIYPGYCSCHIYPDEKSARERALPGAIAIAVLIEWEENI